MIHHHKGIDLLGAHKIHLPYSERSDFRIMLLVYYSLILLSTQSLTAISIINRLIIRISMMCMLAVKTSNTTIIT
jgi:diacylglycerol kinase